MKLTPYTLLLLITTGFVINIHAQQKRPSLGKPPSWVSVNKYDYNVAALEHEAEDGYLDLVYERQISINEQSTFARKTIKILTESGIQNASEVSVNFDPQYQTLTFHTIQVIRDNRIINKLDLSKIKTIQQEEDLKRFVYNGALTAVLFLEDIRKEDIIEYSYTVKGVNPVFKNRFSASLPVEYGVPIANIYYKLIVPKQKEIQYKNNNTSVTPVITQNIDATIYEWKITDMKALHLEDNIPDWYDPFGEIMISEYKSWKDVNDWAMELFPPVKNVSAELRKKIESINTATHSDEQKILSALLFVQDDVRYMGIEIGTNSHKPQDPNIVCAKRFGDCKDKSYLLCTMLKQMNIEAAPVLINTNYKKAITGWPPSAKNFNHATVRVKCNNKYYWLDPTLSLQRGGINNIAYPDYQYGLVVQEGTTALSKIEIQEAGAVVVKEVFNIPDMSGNARLKVTTQYSGSYADDMRNQFNDNSNYEMKKTFKDYYASYYKDISIDSLSFVDEDSTGILTTTEYYSVKNLWEKEGKVKKAFFDPYVINGVIKKPKESKRTMPYALSYPANYKETVEINVPDDWSGEESQDKIQTNYLIVKSNFSYKKRKFTLNFEYQNLQDHIPPEQIKKFLEEMKKKEDMFGYNLTLNEDNSASDITTFKTKNVYPVLFRLGAMLLVIGGIIWLIAKRNRG
ncbi:MAG: DUF3857 domain-containing protein [Agriterribacter sp.]